MKKESTKKETTAMPVPPPPTKNAKPAQQPKATKGRAAFIHGLRGAGVSKKDALAQTQEKFKCSPSLFDHIWKRDALGAVTGSEEKPETKEKK